MHLDFNSSNARFIQDLPEEDLQAFTYNFKKGLKVTLNPPKEVVSDGLNIDK
jgi:hypothetical protein